MQVPDVQRLCTILIGACALAGAAHGTSVPDALERPALEVRTPARSVLLGAAQCRERLLAVGERGLVVTSTDQGKTWRQSRVPAAVTLTAVRCPGGQAAYAVGHGGIVLASTDGGLSWVRRLDGHAAAKLALDAARAGGNPKAVQEAQRQVAEGADKPFLDLHFFDERRGIVVGAYGLAFATQDAGQTWQPLMQRLAQDPADHQARFDLAMAHYAAGNRQQAIDELLEIVRRNREWNEQAARKQLLKLFEAMGPTDEMTVAGRRRLSSILFS